jgi:RNA polymerase primary sigma factor
MEEVETAVVSNPANVGAYDENVLENLFVRSIKQSGAGRKEWSKTELAAIVDRIHGDSSEKEKLLAQHELACTALFYMLKIIRSYRNRASRHVGALDLISIGYLGLFRAAEDYDPSAGTFTTYATAWVHQHVKRAFMNEGRTVRVPVNKIQKAFKFLRAREELTRSLGRIPLLDEIALHQGISIETADGYRSFLDGEFSLDMPAVVGEESEGFADTIQSMTPDENAESPSDVYETKELYAILWMHMSCLEDREREILRRRFGLDDEEPQTLAEIAEDIGLTRERIRQIQEIALDKLRRKLGRDKTAFL